MILNLNNCLNTGLQLPFLLCSTTFHGTQFLWPCVPEVQSFPTVSEKETNKGLISSNYVLCSNFIHQFFFVRIETCVLKINLEKCRCIIGGPLSREFYTYGDVVVCRNFLMDVEKYLII